MFKELSATKASIPAIEGILMKAEDHELTLTGYDLEVGITTSIEARVEQEGSIILNARLLCDILRRLLGRVFPLKQMNGR